MTYEETLKYIHEIGNSGCRPGLERITYLLDKLGNPQDYLRFIHVGGTNGKGSFSAMCDSVLRTAGYKTGLYTSPYIERFNERIVIDGKPIDDGELSEITETVKKVADTMPDRPTEFELITAVAMLAFKKHACDPVVLEVGLGGRLDATNTIKTTILSVITGISLDHTAILGDTVEKIAFEKAGIIKNGVPTLYGGNDSAALGVIKAVADEKKSQFFVTDRNSLKIEKADLDGTTFSYKGQSYHINLLGLYQPYNAANVIEAVEILRSRGFDVGDDDLIRGLESAVWKGRFELLSKSDPTFIIDGSHNPEGVTAAVKSIKHYFGDRKVCLLSGVMKDKNYADMAAELSEVAAVAVTLSPDNPRALNAESYAEEFRKNGVPAFSHDTIQKSVNNAVEIAKKEHLAIVALGSLYMYGDVKHAFLK